MLNRIKQALVITAMTAAVFIFSNVAPAPEPSIEMVAETVVKENVVYASTPTKTDVEVQTLVRSTKTHLSQDEIELVALVTMAEAEGESEEGKRLVIDTILNRVDANHLGDDTVREVIYHKGQFSSMWNGRVDRCYVDEDICQLVREELDSRTNSDVMYFHARDYGKYGTPLFSVGNHYFSGM